MKNIILIFIAIALLASCATQPKTTLEKVKEIPNKEVADNWYLFDFANGDSKVKFPKEPLPNRQKIPTEMGELDMKLFICEMTKSGEEDVIYAAGSVDYPFGVIHSNNTEKLDEYFRESVDGAVGNLAGKLLSEENIELDGFPGRAVQIDMQNGLATVNMRTYLIGSRMYILQTITEGKKDKTKYINHFFDSFEVSEAYKIVSRKEVVTAKTSDGWHLVESKVGAYKASFPNIPIESNSMMPTEIGDVPINTFMLEGTEMVYMSMYTVYPDSLVNSETTDLNEFYTNVIDSAKNNIDGELSYVKDIKLDKNEGREAKLKLKDGMVITMRVFLIENKMYMLQAANVTEKEYDESTKRFLDSFELTNE